MRIYYRTGIELPAGQIRAMIPGHLDHGETTPQELAQVMRIFGLRPVILATPPDAIQETLRRGFRQAIPPIVLGTWLAPNTLHWVLGVHADSNGLTVNDPWDGSRRVYSWPMLTARYAGWCIV